MWQGTRLSVPVLPLEDPPERKSSGSHKEKAHDGQRSEPVVEEQEPHPRPRAGDDISESDTSGYQPGDQFRVDHHEESADEQSSGG